ncbi:MAG: hypothetical protein H5U29_14430, partial [Pusillimonas sp.]|nr:hypothetical protein [Pusillimonas sp.]
VKNAGRPGRRITGGYCSDLLSEVMGHATQGNIWFTLWHNEDVLEIHPQDAEDRGVNTGDWVAIQSRAGETVLRADVTNRVPPGVIYTTFHFPESGANVVTTDSSDWATNCPEYKVTAVQVKRVTQPSEWQSTWAAFSDMQNKLLEERIQDTATEN